MPLEESVLDDRAEQAARPGRPRVGFLGVGWIGRHRMQAIAAQGCVEVAALADESAAALDEAQVLAPRATPVAGFEALLALPLEGLVIATPSALHAAQAEAALARRMAVFCQKPLARTAAEAAIVVDAARRADRLLVVDFCYRHTTAMRQIRALIDSGALGEIHALDLVFHNAYGPDKPWFRDPRLSGGGCVIDLGIHLVDLALWTLGFPPVTEVSSRLWAGGRRLRGRPAVVEDQAVAQLDFASGAVARLACSWNLHAGCDAVIEASFHGSRGGARLRNLNGSFYDFAAERFDGTRTTVLAEPPDEWGGRAAMAWAEALAAGGRFDPAAGQAVAVAEVVDAIYGH